MKKIITSIVVAILITFCLPACKKSSDTQQPQTTQQKIQNKWLLENIVDNFHRSGTDQSSTTIGASTDYFDFRADGKIYYSISTYKDTVTYSLPSDTKILIDGTETYDIKTLTSNSFIIYQKKLLNCTDYDEETITWKK
jgi:hypothetical protein